MTSSFDWAATSGDVWAERWRDTDRGLAEVGEALRQAVLEMAPQGAFDAFDIGCGAGATSIALAEARPDARILACDLSAALLSVAEQRAAGLAAVRFKAGDAVAAAAEEGPFDLLFSRHGVMFFADPPAAFRAFRRACRDAGALVFSCFRGWDENPWASELAAAAAGRELPPPGREPSGFAFADPAYVRELLEPAGWAPLEPEPFNFRYVAGEGAEAVEQALSFLAAIGPASAVLRDLPPEDRAGAVERMRAVIERHCDGERIAFPAAAWIWRAKAD